jgi:hypothetical protein
MWLYLSVYRNSSLYNTVDNFHITISFIVISCAQVTVNVTKMFSTPQISHIAILEAYCVPLVCGFESSRGLAYVSALGYIKLRER